MMLLLLAAAALLSSAEACGLKSIAHYNGNSFIVGGRDARPGSWPWQVQVMLFGSHYCGATLIANRWVLTAAHCVEDYPNSPSRYILGFGSHYKSNRFETNQKNVVPDRIYMHPSYNRRTLNNDFALFRLPSPISYNSYISPACLASREPAGGTYCYTSGWGETLGTGHSNVLKQAYVPIISRSTCNRNYGNSITSAMVCAGYSNGGIDACQGDSGGPLVCSSGSGSSAVWSVVGVTSWGEGCARPGKPGVYANVAAARSWINSVMSANS